MSWDIKNETRDFVKRMYKEMNDLKKKREKLEMYILCNPNFHTLTKVEQLLLKEQLQHMNNYFLVLEARFSMYVQTNRLTKV